MSRALPMKRGPFALTPVPPRAPAETPIFDSISTPAVKSAIETDCLAHDARNWLTVLKVYCDLLRTSGAIARGYEPWMEELSGAIERGQGLVISLLDSLQQTGTNPDAVRSPDDPRVGGSSSSSDLEANSLATVSFGSSDSTLDLSEAIARRLPLFERMAGNAIQVELDTRANTGTVSLPESALERILQNLVGNAIEAMPNGGRLRIALRPANRSPSARPSRRSSDALISKSKRGRRHCKALLLRVYDTGHGIAPERLPYIFEPGFSGKTQRENDRPRHGFGLAIVRDLTERAGGAVRVRSHPGWGSCFEVELPSV